MYRYKLESNNIFEISLKRFGHEYALPYESPHFRSELNLAVISRVSLDLVVASAIWQNAVHSQKRFTGFPFAFSPYSVCQVKFSTSPWHQSVGSMLPSKREGEGLSYSGVGNQNRRQETSTVAM